MQGFTFPTMPNSREVSCILQVSIRYQAGIEQVSIILLHLTKLEPQNVDKILLQNVDVFAVVTSSKASRSQQWKVLVVQVHPWNSNIDSASRWAGKLCSRTPKISQASLLLLTLQTGGETNWNKMKLVLRQTGHETCWEMPNWLSYHGKSQAALL